MTFSSKLRHFKWEKPKNLQTEHTFNFLPIFSQQIIFFPRNITKKRITHRAILIIFLHRRFFSILFLLNWEFIVETFTSSCRFIPKNDDKFSIRNNTHNSLKKRNFVYLLFYVIIINDQKPSIESLNTIFSYTE